jgi:hypothetical protein
LAYGYEIKLENLLPVKAAVTLHDQFPVARRFRRHLIKHGEVTRHRHRNGRHANTYTVRP